MNTIYVLIVMLTYGNGAAVSQIDNLSFEACQAAKAQVERMKFHRESACIEKNFKGSK